MHNVDTLNICMKEFGSQKLIIDKLTVMRTWTIFPDCVRGYSSTCAMIVRTRADQLLSQLLMDSLNTLLSHYRHMEICMKKFDAEKIIFYRRAAL